MFDKEAKKRKICLQNKNKHIDKGGKRVMTQAEQALAEAIGEGYRIVITDHANYFILFFDEDEVVFISKQYINRFKNLGQN